MHRRHTWRETAIGQLSGTTRRKWQQVQRQTRQKWCDSTKREPINHATCLFYLERFPIQRGAVFFTIQDVRLQPFWPHTTAASLYRCRQASPLLLHSAHQCNARSVATYCRRGAAGKQQQWFNLRRSWRASLVSHWSTDVATYRPTGDRLKIAWAA